MINACINFYFTPSQEHLIFNNNRNKMITTIEIYYHCHITIVHFTKCTILVHSKSLHIIRRVEEERRQPIHLIAHESKTLRFAVIFAAPAMHFGCTFVHLCMHSCALAMQAYDAITLGFGSSR